MCVHWRAARPARAGQGWMVPRELYLSAMDVDGTEEVLGGERWSYYPLGPPRT